jgi:D-glycero-alpha-D-manno-heptose-7-phosphate kinase
MGGGTDLPDFYSVSPGRVISTSINQYVYIAINHTDYIDKISVRYSITETVKNLRELNHNRVREALTLLGIQSNIELSSFASVPMRTGLGSSSSFTAALIKGLYEMLGKKIDKKKIAELACYIEINKVNEPIGKQDQYASAVGGLNVLEFKKNGKVDVLPVKMSLEKKKRFEKSLLLFYTGITRDASTVLGKQTKEVPDHVATYKKMAQMVLDFESSIKKGKLAEAGAMLHEGWKLKKSLASGISSGLIDELYDAGIAGGAWGGKILGAGGGGCVLFMADPKRHKKIRQLVEGVAASHQLRDFNEISFEFDTKGVEVLFHSSE